jgi:hypothetical protein
VERGIPRAHPEKAALDFIYLELRNGHRPALDEWNWDELDPERLQEWAAHYPGSVRDAVTSASREHAAARPSG